MADKVDIHLQVSPELRAQLQASAAAEELPLGIFCRRILALHAKGLSQAAASFGYTSYTRTAPEGLQEPFYEAQGIPTPSTEALLMKRGSGEGAPSTTEPRPINQEATSCRHEARKKIRRIAGTNTGEKYCPSCNMALESVIMCPIVDAKGPCKLAISAGHQVCPNHAAKRATPAAESRFPGHEGHDIQQRKKGKAGTLCWSCETCSTETVTHWLEG